MSDLIRLLPDSVANQIAAGEVVQRPASVVKELLENAIDAKASQIQLIVKDAGRTLVQIVDNGKGMSATDARMSFERHATSKIRTTEDIFSIETKGFRGEALASIAAIAQVEMKTKMDEEDLGHFIRIEGSEVKEQSVVQTLTGTSISVKNLFFNVPARRNFLKSNQVEMRHIMDEFHRVSLAHPTLEFSLYHNDNELFKLYKGTFRQRIVAVFGRKYNEHLVPVDEETEVVSVNGFIVKPEFSKKKRGGQFFFVNDRFIKSAYLHKGILEAFDHLLPNGYHPSYFIHLKIDPKRIDINIHPTKTEIKFDDEYSIFAILRSAIKHSLGQYNIAPSLDFDVHPDLEVTSKLPQGFIKEPSIKVNPNFNPFENTKPSSSEIHKTTQFYESFKPNDQVEKESSSTENTFYQNLEVGESSRNLFDEEMISSAKSLQIHQKYILFQAKLGVMIIDQYRAHQRILFERYLEQLVEQKALSQQLMFPISISVTELEKSVAEEIEPTLIQLGFDIEILEETLLVKAIPTTVEQKQVSEIIENLMEKVSYQDQLNQMENIALSIARSTAIKRGQNLTKQEMEHLIGELFATSNPNYSPEGKSIFLNLTLDFIKTQLG
ncbi:MAG: DNA mismatch repair endonuclease MutL [Flavobacteriales bacterium]